MDVDDSIAAQPGRHSNLRGQIKHIDAAITESALKTFVQSSSGDGGQSFGVDNAVYSGSTRNVLLTTASYSPEKPVILHELFTIDLKLPALTMPNPAV